MLTLPTSRRSPPTPTLRFRWPSTTCVVLLAILSLEQTELMELCVVAARHGQLCSSRLTLRSDALALTFLLRVSRSTLPRTTSVRHSRQITKGSSSVRPVARAPYLRRCSRTLTRASPVSRPLTRRDRGDRLARINAGHQLASVCLFQGFQRRGGERNPQRRRPRWPARWSLQGPSSVSRFLRGVSQADRRSSLCSSRRCLPLTRRRTINPSSSVSLSMVPSTTRRTLCVLFVFFLAGLGPLLLATDLSYGCRLCRTVGPITAMAITATLMVSFCAKELCRLPS